MMYRKRDEYERPIQSTDRQLKNRDTDQNKLEKQSIKVRLNIKKL